MELKRGINSPKRDKFEGYIVIDTHTHTLLTQHYIMWNQLRDPLGKRTVSKNMSGVFVGTFRYYFRAL